MLRGEDVSDENRSLVGIQTQGTQRPLFFVHSIGGGVLYYSDLAKMLGDDQPFYGLQAPGLEDDRTALKTTPELAAVYIEEMRKVQPEGPYLLGGWSYGGVVAFEMAVQLQRQGAEVARLRDAGLAGSDPGG